MIWHWVAVCKQAHFPRSVKIGRNLLTQGVLDRPDAEIGLLVCGMRSGIVATCAVLPANCATTKPIGPTCVLPRRTR